MRDNLWTFLSIALGVYSLVNAYIFMRGWRAIPRGSRARPYYVVVFVLLATAFVGGRLLEGTSPSHLSTGLVWIGSLWLAAGLYFFLTCVGTDLLRAANALAHFFPKAVTEHPRRARLAIAAAACAAVAAIVTGGFLNASRVRTTELRLSIPRRNAPAGTLTMVVASDIHLGLIIGRERFERLIDRINACGPDIVILGGDILDEDVAPVIRDNSGEALRGLSAPLGVYAVCGNHEYIGGIDRSSQYISDHGIRLLMDEAVRVDDLFYLVGRKDRSSAWFTGEARAPLATLVEGLDSGLPMVVLDHQPGAFMDSVAAGADLQISGHTHGGQMWPIGLITASIFHIPYGYRRVDGTHVYVSTGAGTWGPPVRVGTKPEIVCMRLSFE
jgi:hypothetical protein